MANRPVQRRTITTKSTITYRVDRSMKIRPPASGPGLVKAARAAAKNLRGLGNLPQGPVDDDAAG